MKSYIRFIEIGPKTPKHKTSRWEVMSVTDNSFLGLVQWRSGWRRYVFMPAVTTVFDAACLKEVVDFLDEQMGARKKTKHPAKQGRLNRNGHGAWIEK